MEIRVLTYFLAVAREESISRAAQVLHITQPTLSRQLAQLEAEVGVRLFERGVRKIRLTPEGLLLRRRAEEILELADKTARELQEQEKQLEGTVTIGCGELGAMESVAALCTSFREKYPLVRFDLYTATADVVRERIRHGSLDIGVLLEPIAMDEFAFLRFPSPEDWVVLLRSEDPLAQYPALTARQLEGLPLLLPHRLNVRGELANWFGDRFSRLNIAYTGNLSTNSMLLVAAGGAYALVVAGSVPFLDPARLTVRPLSPPLRSGAVFAWRREQPQSPAVQRFIDHAKCLLGMDQA